MNHPALNWTRTNDGNLNDEVVKRAGLKPRQHRHLRTRLDLEYTYSVGLANHLVCRGVLSRNVAEFEPRSTLLRYKVKCTPDTRQHPKFEHVDFEETDGIDVVLVPLVMLRSAIAAFSIGTSLDNLV